jgi:predicted MFS family arabinose efflux permease
VPSPSRPTAEDALDSLVDGDRRVMPGTARSALAHPTFRALYMGAFVSNIGTWMQNAVLGAFAFKLTGSASFVGLIVFAQLGPMLLFSVLGGALADLVDRRRLLIGVAIQQSLLSLALALFALQDDPSRAVLVGLVFAIGLGQAIHAPTYSAVLPALVGPEDLNGAIALNSTQMNASRVVGPAIGGALFAVFGVSLVFALNAVTYLAVIAVLTVIRLPAVQRDDGTLRGWRRLAGGFIVARRDPVVRRVLTTMALFSFFCLPFVTLIPVLAQDNLGVDPKSAGYGVLYGCLGLGAVVGSLSIGTVFAGSSKRRIVRRGLLAFSGFLVALALVRHPAPALALMVIVGAAYFAVVTSLSTLLQEQLDDRVRGRVMALWVMSFGGTVPIGSLVAGAVIEATSITVVMLIGAASAAVLGGYAYLYTREPGPRALRPRRPAPERVARGRQPGSP